ncbi:hypothetical protein ACWC09_47110 [Streptomyces sp. NPDC001617]
MHRVDEEFQTELHLRLVIAHGEFVRRRGDPPSTTTLACAP